MTSVYLQHPIDTAPKNDNIPLKDVRFLHEPIEEENKVAAKSVITLNEEAAGNE